jgi:branched-chain amino acid transport system permease protein
MSVLGGSRHWFGPAVGAAGITALLYAFTAGDYAVAGRAAVGLILILVILFLPEGIFGQAARALERRRVSAAPAIDAAELPAPTAAPPAESKTLLEVRGLSKAFRGVQALAEVDLEVRRGEILGLVGPNGSGKSTLINVVSGHFRPDSGRILFEGRDLAALEAHRIARTGLARTYQIPRPFAHLSVLENVALPAMFGRGAQARPDAEREARRWLAFTGLAGKAMSLPGELNLHQRKFLELARALASRPNLLLLDEVFSGLTHAEIDDAIRLIREIRARGATIVFVEHVIRAVMELTDRIVVLSYGRVIAEGDPRAVMREPEVVTAYLGKPRA